MANPNAIPAPLNKLKASVTIHSLPELNVSAEFMVPEGSSLTFQGQPTTNLPTMTNVARSQEPYLMARLTAHLAKSMPLANAYKARAELDSALGNITVRTDTKPLDPYEIGNCSIVGFDPVSFNGRDAGFVVTIEGVYMVNARAWE